MAKNYRKEKSMYIITSKHLITELSALEYQTNILFDKNNVRMLLSVRKRLTDLLTYIEKVPTYGETNEAGNKERYSMYYEHKKYILIEIMRLQDCINQIYSITKGRIYKQAEFLQAVGELKLYIQRIYVYWYDSKKEDAELDVYEKRKKELSELMKGKYSHDTQSHAQRAHARTQK